MSRPQATALADAVGALTAAHRGESGLHALSTGVDAFAARLALAGVAQQTLDLQYYIWHNDQTGRLLIEQILRAAERGVHVRVLLDDLGKSTDDRVLLALDSHPAVEVRLFNPVAFRTVPWLGALLEFARANRRMHNKAFIADGRVAIVGGRNIGDEYFAAHAELEFADLDAAAIGPVVDSVARAFELYWHSPASVPIATVIAAKMSAGAIAENRARLAAHAEAMRDSAYMRSLRENSLAEKLGRGALPFHWGHAWSVYDHPGKLAAPEDDTRTHLLPKLRAIAGGTQRELFIVSPYFVPGRRGVKFLCDLRSRGVRVVILTNSLASTDVAAVHAGYQRYRKPLLRAGVELYESKATHRPRRQHRSFRGSRRASLHAKTFAFDRRIIFIGSMNFDPRSVWLNTEIGIVFDCPQFARQLPERLSRDLDETACRLALTRGRIVWHTREDGQPVRYTTEPGTRLWQRALMHLFSWLPLERQL